MSPALRTRARHTVQWPVVLWLALIWCLLWRSYSPLVIVGGVLASVVALVVFPLPRLARLGTVRPIPFAYLFARFFADMAVASVQVAWLAIRPAQPPKSSIIEVRLRTTSDFHVTLTALMVSLVPGSLPIEVSRLDHTLYVHWIGAEDAESLAKAHAAILGQELRILKALGTPEQLAAAGLEKT